MYADYSTDRSCPTELFQLLEPVTSSKLVRKKTPNLLFERQREVYRTARKLTSRKSEASSSSSESLSEESRKVEVDLKNVEKEIKRRKC